MTVDPLSITFRLAAACLLATVSAPAQQLRSYRELVRKTLPGVVTIKTYDEGGEPIATGSGLVLTRDGLVATNFHVLKDAITAKVHLNSGDVFRLAGVLEFDETRDFAILKIPAVDLPALPVGNPEMLVAGDPIIAIGSPLGLSGTVTTGVVSEIRQMDGYRMIRHSAAISPGSSGGPLVNEAGEVIGLNTARFQGGENLSMALPISYVRGALSASDGKLLDLRRIHDAVAERDRKRDSQKIEGVLRDNFRLYSDPDGLFSLLVPNAWSVERDRYLSKDKEPDRHILFMASHPDAEKSDIHGWLSDGFRLHIIRPPEGRTWTTEGQSLDRWVASKFKEMLASYSNRADDPPTRANFGNLPVLRSLVVGESPQISRPEAAFLYVGATRECLVVLEVARPAKDLESLKAVDLVLNKSFTTTCAPTSE